MLDHPNVQARLQHPRDVSVQHPETQVRREFFDMGSITHWLAPVPELALTCRVIVARQTAPEAAVGLISGKLRGAYVYALFLTSSPAQCLRVDEMVELYYQGGIFEQVLSDEDAEQDPDRWCSCTPTAQEFWQIVSQWVLNTRLELGLVEQEQVLRRTRWSDGLRTASSSLAVSLTEARGLDELGVEARVERYGPLAVARDWGRASGRFAGHAFDVLENGTLRCPANRILRPQERRKAADGSLRFVYRARKEDCRSCVFARECLGQHTSGAQPRRVSAVRRRVAEPEGARSALVHEEATLEETTGEQHDVVWCDLSGYRIRCNYAVRLRRHSVTLVEARGADPDAVEPAARGSWTRTERAHRRLNWAARLARNRCTVNPSSYTCTVFGVVPALAAYLGLATEPPR